MSNIYYDEHLLEMCRDLVTRTHGKFSIGSENKFHRFVIEIMTGEDSTDFRVWELEHKGNGYDFRVDGGARMRTVVCNRDLEKMSQDKVPVFAKCYPKFIERIREAGKQPEFIRLMVKLDFAGKIWNKPKVYVKGITLSSYSYCDICGEDVKSYIDGVFSDYYFKDFSLMHS